MGFSKNLEFLFLLFTSFFNFLASRHKDANKTSNLDFENLFKKWDFSAHLDQKRDFLDFLAEKWPKKSQYLKNKIKNLNVTPIFVTICKEIKKLVKINKNLISFENPSFP